jgi:RNA polymerase sigma factor (sigma-70 family)
LCFQRHRPVLVGIAYQILGSVFDAEDVVQDAWLRWSGTDRGQVADPRAFLVTVTTRLAIDRLRRARVRREIYVGTWLPEPIATDLDLAEYAALAEHVELALLVVLETLSPVQRADRARSPRSPLTSAPNPAPCTACSGRCPATQDGS